MKKNSLRIPIFDLLRVILMFFVINLHIRIITQGTSNILEQYTWYAVPIFILLSFFLTSHYFTQSNISFKKILSRIKRLFIPLVIWSILGFLLHPEFITSHNISLQLISGGVVNVPLYYLNLLICFTLLFWLLSFIPMRFRVSIYLAIIVVSFWLQYSTINFYFFNSMQETVKKCYGRFFELLPYASGGLLYSLFMEKFKENKKVLFSFGLILLFLFFFIKMMNIGQPPGFHYSGILLFCMSLFIFSVTLFISKIKPNLFAHTIIETLGKYSFGVYLFHYILLEFLLRLLPSLKYFISSFSILFLILYTVFCYVLCFFIDKITHKKLAFLFT